MAKKTATKSRKRATTKATKATRKRGKATTSATQKAIKRAARKRIRRTPLQRLSRNGGEINLNNLREFRLARKQGADGPRPGEPWSQQYLAEKSGVDASTISHAEQGYTWPEEDVQKRLAKALKRSVKATFPPENAPR